MVLQCMSAVVLVITPYEMKMIKDDWPIDITYVIPQSFYNVDVDTVFVSRSCYYTVWWTVMSCRHISGIGDKLAKKIVEHRLSNGPFICRAQLLSVAGLGPKTFEQAAGFLRIVPQCNDGNVEWFVCIFFCCVVIRDVPNIWFVFASVPNSGPNSVFVFGRIVLSERIRIVSLYMQLMTSTAGFTQSVPAALAQTAWLWETIRRMKGRGSWQGSMLNKHLSCKHPHEFKEVLNIRAAGAASKCSATNAIRILIRPNSLKPLFGTPFSCNLSV